MRIAIVICLLVPTILLGQNRKKAERALSFVLQDENKTLTDKHIDKVMNKLIKAFQEKAGAEIRM